MKIFFSTLLLILTGITAVSQDNSFYTPQSFEAAIEKGTRTHSGLPGENYWINRADYIIDVEVFPETGLIQGSSTITYFNNSPDTLENIVMRLYQNIYKKGNSRQFNIGDADVTDGVDISKLRINGKQYDIDSRKVYFSATNMYVGLNDPLLPEASVEIAVDWSFVMPQKRWIRFGQYSSEHLFVAYWYPQVAVYDDIDGWDQVEYAGMAEYYNDPNNFEVNITLPAGFVVWATGELQNPAEVFTKEIQHKIETAKVSDEVISIIRHEDYKGNQVTKSGEKHTWKFTAAGVPDFAFAASTGSAWDAASVVVDRQSNRRVMVSSVYPDSAVHYEDVAMITRNAVEYMSFDLPGYAFPYPQATVFANGRKDGGMEYPMIANDGAPDDYANLMSLTYHEVFHNYCPFFMGTNERKYAFMDEGWAQFLPKGFLEKYAPEDPYFQRSISQYESFAGSENELPPMIPTYIFNDYQTQRMAAYTRPAVAYHLLYGLLGDALFKVAMKEYISVWQNKHPMPWDFFNLFNKAAGEDLEWFWKPWFFDRGHPDLAILEFTDDQVLMIERKGNLPVPVEITLDFDDGTQKQISQDMRMWADGKKILAVPVFDDRKISKITLGNDLIPDSDRS
ncbi:MAG: M1 family metallopeptidase, partial [Bacteroidales bacterium]